MVKNVEVFGTRRWSRRAGYGTRAGVVNAERYVGACVRGNGPVVILCGQFVRDHETCWSWLQLDTKLLGELRQPNQLAHRLVGGYVFRFG
jgi:hypothetical protein